MARTASAPRRSPQRTCVACRTERDKRDLVRVVRTPAGDVVLDSTGRANGRGAYLCADGSCWAMALKKSAIERALSVTLSVGVRGILESGDVAAAQGASHGA